MVVNPIGTVPLLIAITGQENSERRRQIVLEGVIVASLILLFFIAIGQRLLEALYPGLAAAAQDGVKDQIEPLRTQLLKADMFIAFSKKSPCLSQVKAFGRKINAMRGNGAIKTILQGATQKWDPAQR